jgi:hypothetical protein
MSDSPERHEPDQAIAVFRAELADLERQQESLRQSYLTESAKLTEQIRVLQDIIPRRLGTPASAPKVEPGVDERTTRERIHDALAEAGGPIPMGEVVRLVHESGSTTRSDTVRAVLLQMHKAGQVARIRRGMYQLTAAGRGGARWRLRKA